VRGGGGVHLNSGGRVVVYIVDVSLPRTYQLVYTARDSVGNFRTKVS
jgi:hypothetical protein